MAARGMRDFLFMIGAIAAGTLLPGCAQLVCDAAPPSASARAALADAGGGAGFHGRLDVPPEAAWNNLQSSSKPPGFRLVQVGPRPLSLSFRLTADPQRYLDCGSIHVPAAPGMPATNFPGARKSHDYRLLVRQVPYEVKRRMMLDLSVSLRLQGQGRQTAYAYDVDYELTRDQTARPAHGAPIRARDTIRFRNAEEAAFRRAPTRCRGTGRLRGEIEGWMKPDAPHAAQAAQSAAENR